MSFKIDLGAWNGVFAVPNELVDDHLRLASPTYIKAILYLLRHSGKEVQPSELAGYAGLSEGDVLDALAYWQGVGLISQSGGEMTVPQAARAAAQSSETADKPDEAEPPAPVSTAEAPTASEEAPELNESAPAESAPTPRAKERIRYSYGECMDMLAKDETLSHMLGALEGILSKQLNHTEISVFITLVYWYGLPPSCVALLVEYCRSIGKATVAYIEATGIAWFGEDITTVERAVEKIERCRRARTAWATVRGLLDIPDRMPTKKEQEYCTLWLDELGLSAELITMAYERCVDKKGKLAMGYMNGILQSWHKKGLLTPEQVLAEGDDNPAAKTASSAEGRYSATYEKGELDSVLDDDWMDDAQDQ